MMDDDSDRGFRRVLNMLVVGFWLTVAVTLGLAGYNAYDIFF